MRILYETPPKPPVKLTTKQTPEGVELSVYGGTQILTWEEAQWLALTILWRMVPSSRNSRLGMSDLDRENIKEWVEQLENREDITAKYKPS